MTMTLEEYGEKYCGEKPPRPKENFCGVVYYCKAGFWRACIHYSPIDGDNPMCRYAECGLKFGGQSVTYTACRNLDAPKGINQTAGPAKAKVEKVDWDW